MDHAFDTILQRQTQYCHLQIKRRAQNQGNPTNFLPSVFCSQKNYARGKVYPLGHNKYQFKKASYTLNENKDDSLQIMSVRIYN